MADRKNQHYVPRFLLKKFSLGGNDKSINLYNVESKRFITQASISDQASKSYFYSKDLSFESLLSEIETSLSEAVNRVLTEKRIDTAISDSNMDLYTLVNIQRLRTESFFNDVSMISRVCLEALPISEELKNFPYKRFKKLDKIKQINIETFITNCLRTPILFDLSFRLLENQTGTSFITSDNPVVVFNIYLHNYLEHNIESMALKGVSILLPLSPEFCLLLIDNKYIACRNDSGLCCVSRVEDVNEINALQYLNRPKNLFFNELVSKEYIEKIITRNQHYMIPIQETISKKAVMGEDGYVFGDCVFASNVKHKKRPRISFIMNKAILSRNVSIPLKDFIRDPALCTYVDSKRERMLSIS